MDSSSALKRIMQDPDYNISDGSSLDEEEGNGGASFPSLDVLDIVQVSFLVYFYKYFGTFRFLF